MNTTLLSLQSVSKRFGNQRVLDNLSLSVNQGEIIALVGPSGSGKSTLMNVMMKSVLPDSGEIWLDGRAIQDYTDNKVYAQKIGMLHQQYHLVNSLEVVHNVLAGRLNRWGVWKSLLSLLKPQERELAESALQAVGLHGKLTKLTSELSGGEQQRVAIARLLVQDPMLILADEPVSALDPVNAQNVLSLLTSLVRHQRKTLIASMHSVEYAKTYFDRLVGIRHGKLVFDLPSAVVSQTQLDELYGVVKNAE